MEPSDHPHPTHPTASVSPYGTRDVMADGWACAPDFARNPHSRADSSCPPARHAARPNRVHFCLGLVFRLGLLSTCPRGHAVALGYLEVARCFKTQTFTGWFHKRISARTAETCLRFRGRSLLSRIRRMGTRSSDGTSSSVAKAPASESGDKSPHSMEPLAQPISRSLRKSCPAMVSSTRRRMRRAVCTSSSETFSGGSQRTTAGPAATPRSPAAIISFTA